MCDIVKDEMAITIWLTLNILLWFTVSIRKIINKQLNAVIGSVFKKSLFNERLSFNFSYKRCLMECKKQKYIKKETKGLKYVKQKISNIISIIKFLDIFFSKKLIRKKIKIKIAKYKKNSLQK